MNLIAIGGSLVKYGGAIVKYAVDCLCCSGPPGCCPGTQIKDCTPERFNNIFGTFPYLNGSGDTHCIPSEWTPMTTTQEECETCVCNQHSDWLYIDCNCDGEEWSCDDCPPEYVPYGVIILSDCSDVKRFNSPACPGDPGKQRCIRKTTEQLTAPCCEVSDEPPTDCFGNVANAAGGGGYGNMVGLCGTFYSDGCEGVDCGYEEFP